MDFHFTKVTTPPGRREDWMLNDAGVASLPPTMAHCYRIWRNTETQIHHWSNSRGGNPQFLAFFSKYVTMPCYGCNQPFPFYAYFGNVDDVLKEAKRYGIDKQSKQLYEHLLAWAQNTRCTIRTYAPDSDRYRIELCILRGMKPVLADERLRLDQGVINFPAQSISLYNQLNTLDVIEARLNNAIAILKHIRVEHRQDPDNLVNHGPSQSTSRYENASELDRQILWRITNDITKQELSELAAQTGLRRDLQVRVDHPIVMARFNLYHNLFRPQLTVSIITRVRNSLMGVSS